MFRSPRGTDRPILDSLTLEPGKRNGIFIQSNIELVEVWCDGEFVLSCLLKGKEILSGRLTPVRQPQRPARAAVEIPVPKAIRDEIKPTDIPSRVLAPMFG